MTQDETLQISLSPLPTLEGRYRHLVKLNVQTPQVLPIALVFDLSDSSPSSDQYLPRVQSLLSLLPRTTPVWLYRLSSKVPLDLGRHLNVGHILDRTLSIGDVLSSRQLLTQAKSQGSFIGPTLTGIDARAQDQLFTDVLVLVFTDGDLSDFTRVPVPAHYRIVGVATKSMISRNQNWPRVFPGLPLLGLDTPTLDDLVCPPSHATAGSCTLTIQSDIAILGTSFVDVVHGTVIPFDLNGCRWNFRDGPAVLCLLTTTPRLDGVTLQVAPISRGSPLLFRLDRNTKSATSGDVEQVMSVLTKAVNGSFDLITHVSSRDDRTKPWFDLSAEIIRTAILRGRLGKQRLGELINVSEINHCFNDAKNSLIYDAILCAQTARERDREAVFFGLRRSSVPALLWQTGTEVLNGRTETTLKIWWDTMEGRWLFSTGGQAAQEMNPNGAQLMKTGLFKDPDGVVLAFTGDLQF